MKYKVNLVSKEFVILLRKRKGSSIACNYCKYSLNKKAFSELQEPQHCDREKIARDTGGIKYDRSLSFCTYLEKVYVDNFMYFPGPLIYSNEFISNIIPISVGDSIYKYKYILKHNDDDRILVVSYDRVL